MNSTASMATRDDYAFGTSPKSPSTVTMVMMTSDGDAGGLVSDYMLSVFNTANLAGISQLISVFGTFTNSINIIVFAKIGFKDSINVSFFCLAISDLGSLVTLAWLSLCFNPFFMALDLPFDSFDTHFLTGGWPHITFTRITSCITGFITLERCLCIAMPMKIKQIFTPRRVALINIIIFVVLIISVVPVYYATRLGPKYFPNKNKTVIGLVFVENRELFDNISYMINNVLIPHSAFSMVVVCTITLVIKLRIKTKWRERSISSEQSSQFTDRDQKVSKMVMMLSSLFIVCYFPMSVIFITRLVEPELSIHGRYRNMTVIITSFAFILESINSSVNIFFYFRMSSRYKAVVETWYKRFQRKG